MKHIKQFPHCDPRILHTPGKCATCDHFPIMQELRKAWQIAYTGEEPVKLPDVRQDRTGLYDAVLPCPADFIRGDRHAKWGGNRATPKIEGKCDRCKKEIKDFVPPDGTNTSGYYYIPPNSSMADGWRAFVDEGEHIVCDVCMWSDRRYIEVFGHVRTSDATGSGG